jgi:hypothetical protein
MPAFLQIASLLSMRQILDGAELQVDAPLECCWTGLCGVVTISLPRGLVMLDTLEQATMTKKQPSDRDVITVQMSRALVHRVRLVATYRGIKIPDYLDIALTERVNRDLAAEQAKLKATDK